MCCGADGAGCHEHGLWPINDETICQAQVANIPSAIWDDPANYNNADPTLPAGCYWYYDVSWFALPTVRFNKALVGGQNQPPDYSSLTDADACRRVTSAYNQITKACGLSQAVAEEEVVSEAKDHANY